MLIYSLHFILVVEGLKDYIPLKGVIFLSTVTDTYHLHFFVENDVQTIIHNKYYYYFIL